MTTVDRHSRFVVAASNLVAAASNLVAAADNQTVDHRACPVGCTVAVPLVAERLEVPLVKMRVASAEMQGTVAVAVRMAPRTLR